MANIPENIYTAVNMLLATCGESIETLTQQKSKESDRTDSEQWITRKEAAIIARVSTDTIDNWRESGCIKSTKTNKARCGHVAIDRESLEFFLQSNVTSSSNDKEVANV